MVKQLDIKCPATLDIEDYIESQGGQRGSNTFEELEEELLARFEQTLGHILNARGTYMEKAARDVVDELKFTLKKNGVRLFK